MLNLSRRALHIRRFSPTCPSPAMFPAISYGSGGSLPSVSPPARQVSFIATSHASFRNPALNNVSSEEDALFGEPQLPREQVTRRIIEVVKSFEKVSAPDLVKETTHFVKDLGLDSLDVVEVRNYVHVQNVLFILRPFDLLPLFD